MRAFLLCLVALLVHADSASLQRKADEKRVAEYHRLNRASKRAAARMQEFAEAFSKVCQSRGQELRLDTSGDPQCQNKPPATPAK